MLTSSSHGPVALRRDQSADRKPYAVLTYRFHEGTTAAAGRANARPKETQYGPGPAARVNVVCAADVRVHVVPCLVRQAGLACADIYLLAAPVWGVRYGGEMRANAATGSRWKPLMLGG
jgi:hypothetical protein